MVMIKANIYEVKAKLSEYLDRAVRGEHIVICRHNKPVAELRAIDEASADPRPVGPLPGRPTFEIPASFFEPMPDDELDLWERVTSKDPLAPGWTPPGARGTPKVIEARSKNSTRSGRRPVRRRP